MADRSRPASLADLGACLLLVGWLAHSWRFDGVDPDLFWHLKYGQLFLAARGLDVDDDFAWTVPHAFWLDHEWGGEVLFAWIFGLAGLDGLQHARWLLFAGTLALAVRMFMRGGLAFAPAALGGVALHVMLYGQTVVRVQNFTVALLLVTGYVLQTWWLHRRLDAVGWSFPLIVVAWANLHGGGAIAGAATCAIALAAEAAACLRTGRWAELRPLAYLAVGAGLALFVNPAGWHVPALSLAMVMDGDAKAVNALVREWQRPDVRDPLNWSALAGAAAVAAAGLAARTRPAPGMVAIAAAWGLLACMSQRNLPLATMVAVPLAAAWAGAVRGRAVGYGLAAACVGAIALSPQLRHTRFSPPVAYPSAPALEAVVALAPAHRMLNLYGWGGLLLFAGHPPLKVSIDGRGYPYGPQLLREHATMLELGPGWEGLMARHRVDMVVVPPATPLAHELAESPAWRVAFVDSTAIVLVKR